MSLNYYRLQVRRLLQNPTAPTWQWGVADLDSWINTARGRIAGESESVRALGTLSTVVGQTSYKFSSISTGVPSVTGIQGVLHMRSLLYAVASGYQWVRPRPWEWFQLYHMNNPVPISGPPEVWSQFAQGAAPPGINDAAMSGAGGSFYLDPPPDLFYSLLIDCTCYPIALTNDGMVEAIPYPWTDAIPFLAAWYALLSATPEQQKQRPPEVYYNHYQTFMQQARQMANASVNRPIYEQSVDPTLIGKLGVQQRGQSA